MKNVPLLLVSLISCICISCSSGEETNSDLSPYGLEIIKVDLSEAREGKLSEFFEPEIEYIWLKDDSSNAMVGSGFQKILFQDEKIFVLGTFGCNCIQIFDLNGNYLNQIKSFGEGPGEYLEFNDAIINNNEIMLVGVYPRKLMWFNLDGEFLREQKVEDKVRTGAYSKFDSRYYFYSSSFEEENYLMQSVDATLKDSLKSIPFNSELYYGNYGGTGNFKVTPEALYFGMPFQDTVYQLKSGKAIPKLVFDFGEYGQSQEELKMIDKNSTPPEKMDFINDRAKLYFLPTWYVTESQFYANFRYLKESFSVFYNRENQTSNVIKGKLINDLDGSISPFSFFYQFSNKKSGTTLSGKELFEILEEKKLELGPENFDGYVNGKGKNFALEAFAAKDSENPVLIVYTVKK